MKRLAVIAAFGLSLLSAPAPAVEVAGLYRGEAQVTGNDTRERGNGTRMALTDVLIKVSGEPAIADSPAGAAILADPAPLIATFSYEDLMKHLPIGDEQGTRDRPFRLTVDFKPAAVDDALRARGLAPLPADRPLVAVGLWVKTAARAFPLAADGDDGIDLREALLRAAARRGVPVVLPATGQAAALVTAAGVDPAALRATLGAPAALGGAIAFAGVAGWHGDWQYVGRSVSRDWAEDAGNFDAAMRAGLDGVLRALRQETR